MARALVTGAARGLGEAVAARFVTDGWRVALVDVAPEVDATAVRLAESVEGGGVVGVVADVADERDVERAVGAVVAAFGGVDVLVNNAGVGGPSTTVLETDTTSFRGVLDVNLVGSFLMAREVGRILVEQGTGGAIVNLGSILGQRAEGHDAAYAASKGGIALLTQALALELAPYGVRVNTIAPGYMATEMHWEYVRELAASLGVSFEDARERVRGWVPLGRHGTGQDIAGAVAWLCSDDAAYVTGQTIGVNGGVVLT